MVHEIACSIILPACHGGEFLRKALCSLERLDFPCRRFEVLVAGSSGDAGACEIVTAHQERVPFALDYVASSGRPRAA